MKRGAKPVSLATKIARGTVQPCRDDVKVGVVTMAGAPPAMPDYLKPAAKAIWAEEIERVMASGIEERDSSLFAKYCSLEAMIRQAFKSGEPPPAAYLTESRRLSELLGIAGPRVRTAIQQPPGQKRDNPFASRGRRPAG